MDRRAQRYSITRQFWLNVLLTILGYIPGLAHAVYIILTRR